MADECDPPSAANFDTYPRAANRFRKSIFVRMQKLRNLMKMLLAWAMLLLIVGIVLEVVLQVRDWMRSSNQREARIVEHTANPFFGTWRVPNQDSAVWKAECFEATDITINSLGMRSEEPNPDKKVKVGWFGDSMIQGYEVSKNDHFLYRLNKADKRRDHLNFGIAATGTITQYQNLLYHLDSIALDEVVLCLYLSNDVWNNSYNISVVDGWELDKPVPFLRIDDATAEYYIDRSRIEAHTDFLPNLETVKLLAGPYHNLMRKWEYKVG